MLIRPQNARPRASARDTLQRAIARVVVPSPVGRCDSAIFRTDVIDAALDQPIWGTALAWNIAGFVAALLVTHLLLGVAAWCLAKLSRQAWPQSKNSLRVWTLFWLVLAHDLDLRGERGVVSGSSLGSPYAGPSRQGVLGASVLQLVTIVSWAPSHGCSGSGAREAWPFVRRRPKWTIGRARDRRQRNGVRLVRRVGSRRECDARTTTRHFHRTRRAAARCAA